MNNEQLCKIDEKFFLGCESCLGLAHDDALSWWSQCLD
jgi:hypothetical protein